MKKKRLIPFLTFCSLLGILSGCSSHRADDAIETNQLEGQYELFLESDASSSEYYKIYIQSDQTSKLYASYLATSTGNTKKWAFEYDYYPKYYYYSKKDITDEQNDEFNKLIKDNEATIASYFSSYSKVYYNDQSYKLSATFDNDKEDETLGVTLIEEYIIFNVHYRGFYYYVSLPINYHLLKTYSDTIQSLENPSEYVNKNSFYATQSITTK